MVGPLLVRRPAGQGLLAEGTAATGGKHHCSFGIKIFLILPNERWYYDLRMPLWLGWTLNRAEREISLPEDLLGQPVTLERPQCLRGDSEVAAEFPG